MEICRKNKTDKNKKPGQEVTISEGFISGYALKVVGKKYQLESGGLNKMKNVIVIFSVFLLSTFLSSQELNQNERTFLNYLMFMM